MIVELHHWLAVLSAVLVAAVVLESAWHLRRPRASRLQGPMLIALGATVAGGLGLLIGGARPHELLHFLYAVLAIGALPVTAELSGRWSPGRQRIATLIAALVALVIVFRLFATG